MDRLTAAGLGLDYESIRLERTTDAWLAAGTELRDRVAELLDGVVADVELIGSSSVVGLLAKPIIDLAVGLTADQALSPVATRLAGAGWIYRGDAGDNGGQVFVLEARPWHRIAHLHVVDHEGSQWQNYLRFRDLLRRSPDARERYETEKLRLAEQVEGDRTAYTSGKSDVVTSLIGSNPSSTPRFVPRWDGSDPVTEGQLFSRFTQRARNALATAAAIGGSAAVSADAIVVGLLSEPDGLAAKILYQLGVTDDAVTASFGRQFSDVRPDADAGALRQIPFADDAKDLLRGTLKAVLRLGHNYVGTEHLLLGALFANGATATTLQGLGVSAEAVEAGIAAEITRIKAERRDTQAS